MVEDHRHCVVCGKPTAPDHYLCSPSCEEIFKRQQRRYQHIRLITMGMVVAVFLILLLLRSGAG